MPLLEHYDHLRAMNVTNTCLGLRSRFFLSR